MERFLPNWIPIFVSIFLGLGLGGLVGLIYWKLSPSIQAMRRLGALNGTIAVGVLAALLIAERRLVNFELFAMHMILVLIYLVTYTPTILILARLILRARERKGVIA